MYYLSACNRVIIAIFCFCHSKNPSDVMKNILNSEAVARRCSVKNVAASVNSISMYSWKKIS